MNDARQVLLTGCDGGIGRALAKRLRDDGFEVIGLDRVKHCASVDHYYPVDLASHEALRSVLVQIDQVVGERLYGLVNNAGLYLALDFATLSLPDYERVMAVNARAPLFLAQWFAARMAPNQQRGVIINVASISGEHGSPDVAYGVSKGAMLNLGKSLLAALSPRVRVITVSPGVIDTQMAQLIPDERLECYRRRTASERLGQPEDVANAIAFLLQPDNDYINGATFNVDGGFH